MAGSTAHPIRLALLIDGDNVRADFLPLIMREISILGTLTIRRLYGQFADGKMKSWQKHIHDHALTPVQVSPATRGKNATDMKLVVDAMDMLHERPLDGFCIVSSDSDFTTLASRIRENGIVAYGFGEKKAPVAYKAAFDRFFPCDDLLAAEKKTRGRRPAAPPAPTRSAPARTAPPQAAPARRLPIPTTEIHAAIDEARDKDGWSRLGTVGKNVRKVVTDFTSKKYGYRTMSELIGGMKGIESRSAPGGAVFVRRK